MLDFSSTTYATQFAFAFRNKVHATPGTTKVARGGRPREITQNIPHHTQRSRRASHRRVREDIYGTEAQRLVRHRTRGRAPAAPRPVPRGVHGAGAWPCGCPLQSVVDPIDLLRLYISGSRAVYSQLILRGPAACWRPDHEPDTGRRNLRTALRRGRSSTSTEDARSWSRIHAVTHERCMSAAAASS